MTMNLHAKLVKILKKNTNMDKNFCAIIHGKYNDNVVINEITALIDAESIQISESSFIKNKYIFSFVYFLILLSFYNKIIINI